jgi:Tfp pilus assembly protein PilF
MTVDGLCKARDYLHQAIALDPMFAGAHAALADVHVALGAFGVVRSQDAFAQAEASARRALELDSNLGEAHRTMGVVRMYYWDWPGADAALERAMAAAPGSAETHSHYAFYLIARGRCAEAVASDDHARSLDPLSPMIG